jgi:hypothetical protein
VTWFGDIYGEQCVPVLFEFLGESSAGTYTSPTGDETACTGIITNVGKVEQEDETGTRVAIECEWIISVDPDSDYGGVANPETKATATIGGVLYAVRDVEAISENLAKLSLVRLPIKRRSREGFRRGGAA